MVYQPEAPRVFLQQGNHLSRIDESMNPRVKANVSQVDHSMRLAEDVQKFKIQFDELKQKYEAEIFHLRARNEELIKSFNNESSSKGYRGK